MEGWWGAGSGDGGGVEVEGGRGGNEQAEIKKEK